MWIDIKDRSLDEVVAEVRTRYPSQVEAAKKLRTTDAYDFRHAVTLVSASGEPVPLSRFSYLRAFRLLREWGAARGGIEVETDIAQWEYGSTWGFCMTFIGDLTDPVRPTRLTGEPSLPGQELQGREERYVIGTEERSSG
jgi:hypothetical protein